MNRPVKILDDMLFGKLLLLNSSCLIASLQDIKQVVLGRDMKTYALEK